MRTLIFTMVVLTLATTAAAQEQVGTFKEGYAGVAWGTDTSMARAILSKTHELGPNPYDAGLPFIYVDTINGDECVIGPVLVDGSVYKFIVSFKLTYESPDLWLREFERLEGLLTEKYGRPKIANKYRSDNPYVTTGEMVELEKGEWRSYWETRETAILLSAFSVEGRIRLAMSFTCRALSIRADQIDRAKAKEKL